MIYDIYIYIYTHDIYIYITLNIFTYAVYDFTCYTLSLSTP